MSDRRTALAVIVEVLGVILAVAGAAVYAWPLGVAAIGLALVIYVAPMLEVDE